jgi:predicted neuraminidase
MNAPVALAPLDLSGRLVPAADDPARLEAFLPSSSVQNHAANLMPFANGDLACVWFGGTQEGVSDISAYFSRLAAGSDAWTPAVKLSDDPTRSEQNPVLFPAPDGTLWLLYTAQVSGNQDTAIVRVRRSPDNGVSWGPVETLFEGAPGLGIFIRQPVTVLANGDWLLPVFHCRTRPGVKWTGAEDTSGVRLSSDQGRTWREVAVPDSLGLVHMNIVVMADGTLTALFRSRWADHVYLSRSLDNGRTWSAPAPTELPNNNSSIQAIRLADGRLAMVFNESSAMQARERRLSLYDDLEGEAPEAAAAAPQGRAAFWGAPRAPMTLAFSADGGRTWPWRRNLEVGDGYCMTNNSKDGLNREYSYPSIKQTPDGLLHIAYTYHRRAIKYVRVAPDWAAG